MRESSRDFQKRGLSSNQKCPTVNIFFSGFSTEDNNKQLTGVIRIKHLTKISSTL